MPRNGSGVYTLPAGNPVITGTAISSTTQNNTMSDVASELTNSIAADGQKTPTANLPMGNFRHTGVSDATARNQYASAGQVQDSSLIWCGTAGGTANALTFSPIPAITAYVAGQVFRFKSGATPNSGATTIAVSGLAAIALEVNGAACIGNEIAANKWYEVFLTSPTNAQLRFSSGDITLTNAKINFAAPVSIASASTVNLSTATSNTVNLTGTTAVTAWTMPAGTPFRVNFTAATPITYNATTNRIQGGSSITGEVGSYMLVYYDGTTTFVDYILGNGAAAAGPSYTTIPPDITTTGATLTNNAVGVVTKINSATATTTTLPAVSTLFDGQSLTLSNVGAGIATFNRAGSDVIIGCNLSSATSIVLNQNESVTLTRSASTAFLVTSSNVSFFGAKTTAVATTSGTAFDFTIPPNPTSIDIALSEVSLSSTGDLLIQIGTGGVPTTTGYASTSSTINAGGSALATSTSGFVIRVSSAAGAFSGIVNLKHMGSNIWVCAHNGKILTTNTTSGGGSVTLAGALNIVRVTRTSTDTFDAGLVNVVDVR